MTRETSAGQTGRPASPRSVAFRPRGCSLKHDEERSEVGFQHHAIAGLALANVLQRLVDLRHREQLGGRRDFAASGKFHQLAQLGRVAGGRTGDAAVAANQGKSGDRERLHYRADGVEVAAVRQRFKVRLPVEVDGDGVDNQVELAGQRL